MSVYIVLSCLEYPKYVNPLIMKLHTYQNTQHNNEGINTQAKDLTQLEQAIAVVAWWKLMSEEN